ncbi:BamA/TamA family outer membrane protein [Glycocaulis profundi]|nr:BamA/TamA family outer membrane protein [Glycocaulis profundi]
MAGHPATSSRPVRVTCLKTTLPAIALLLFAAEAALADVPRARIEGVENRDLREALVEIAGTEEARSDNRWRNRDRARRAADRVRRYLDSEGYFGALVDPRIDEDLQPVVRVVPGERFTYSRTDVVFNGPPDQEHEPGEAISSLMGIEAGDPVRAQPVITGEAATTDALRNAGWPYAETGEHAIVADHVTGEAEADFIFSTGPYLRFGEPQQAGGLADLRPEFIARLAPYEYGDPASQRRLAEYTQRLQGLQSIALAETRLAPESEADGNIRPVDIRMEPNPRHRIELGARYSTTEGVGTSAEWARRNVFRGDETWAVNAQLATLVSGLGTSLTLPHWRRYAQTLEFGAEVFAERTDAFDQNRLTLRTALSRPITETLFASVGVEAQIAEITDATGRRQLNTISLPTGLAYDDRDDRLDPTQGIAGELTLRPGYTFGDDTAQYVRAEFAARTYFSLAERVVIAVQGRVGSLLGADAEQVPADIRFFSGGGGSVRGYGYQTLSPRLPSPVTGELEIFGGRSLLEGAVEARYRFSDTLGFVAFVDAGAASFRTYPDVSDLRYGAGVGVRYYPGFGPIRADIATPIDPRPGDDPVQLYISIGQAF